MADITNIQARIPSTDKSVWGAEYKIGDKVKIREDFSKTHNVNKVYTIEKVEVISGAYKEDKKGNNIGGFQRPENPTGKLYSLSDGGGAWEGKDLEPEIQAQTPTQNLTIISSTKNDILNKLQEVEKGDVIKVITKKDGSIFYELEVITYGIGNNDWYIEVIDTKGVKSNLRSTFWEAVLKEGDLEIQINDKIYSEQAQTNIDKLIIVYCLINKQVGYITNIEGWMGAKSNKKIWEVNFKDGSALNCYRDEFIVRGDTLELTSQGGINSKILVSQIKYDEIEFYDIDLVNGKIDTDLSRLSIDSLKNFKINLIDPTDDISTSNNINLTSQVSSKVYGFDFEFNRLVEVIELGQSFGDIESDVWTLSPVEISDNYNQTRKDFFVVGDVVKFTLNKDKTIWLYGKVTEIDVQKEVVKFYNVDYDNYGNFPIDYFDNWKPEIRQFYNLKELFDKPVLVPKEQVEEIVSESTLTELDQAKKDLGQLLFIRSLISPIDF